MPEELIDRLQSLPGDPLQALSLARDLSETLDGEQQLWIVNWWQQHLWNSFQNAHQLRRLEVLRRQLLSFVQPRLAWEVALLDLMNKQPDITET